MLSDFQCSGSGVGFRGAGWGFGSLGNAEGPSLVPGPPTL